MAIIWGTKRVEKILGYAADFCPICRVIQPYSVSSVGMFSHIYFIPISKKKSFGYLGECKKCGIKRPVDVKKYKGFRDLNLAASDFAGFIQQTYPEIHGDYAARLELEKQIKAHQILAPAERLEMLQEPFYVLENSVRERYANTRFDKESGFGCLGSLMVSIAFCCGFTLQSYFSANVFAIYSFVLTVLGCVGLVYTVVQLMLAPRRYVRREITQLLAQTLLPLNPTRADISDCLLRCKMKGLRIAAIKDEKLWEKIQELRGM